MLSKKVLWIKVWGIAAVHGSITLTWVIYNLYFPLLLVQFGFKPELAIAILIIENALESIIEPIFGGLSDRQQRLFGSKVPLISCGIILASVLFILFPCLAIFGLKQFSLKWLLPILAIIWAGAMATFRAPTMALLRRYATTDTLPQAASILTLVGGIIGAFRFDAYGLILNLGSGFAFALGSFSLLIAAFILRILNPVDLSNPRPSKTVKIPRTLLCLIFTTGVWISWSLRFIMPAVREVLKIQFGEANGKLAMTIFMILLGLAAIPAGKIATRFDNHRTMQLGVIGIAITLLWLTLSSNFVLPLVFLISCLSLVLNGIVPLILNIIPQERSGLGIGFYFGGFGAGMSTYDFIFTQFLTTNFSINIIAAISLLSLLCCWLLILPKQSVYH